MNVNINQKQYAALGSDVALLQTSDGIKMIDLWLSVIQPSLEQYNAQLNLLASFLAYKSDLAMEEVVQTVGSRWQKNTEVTKGTSSRQVRGFWVRTASNEYKHYMGWTRKFIKENSASYLTQQYAAELKALTEQKYTEIMSAFYANVERSVLDPRTHETLVIPTLVNGTGNMPIPSVGTNVFASNHTHFMGVDSGATAWTTLTNREAQLKNLVKLVKEHGYYQNLVIMVNSNMSDEIMACPSFRAFVGTSSFGTSDASALTGTDVQATLQTFKPLGGLFRVLGTLPFATVLESDVLPNRYVSAFSYGGPNSLENPVQYMESPVSTFSDSPYPFYETIFETAFGASVRKRLNGAHMLVDASVSSYVAPSNTGSIAGALGDWDGN